MEERESPSTSLTCCQNPICAMEKKILEDMVQTNRIECRGSCAMELKQLKEEMSQLKRDMHDLMAKKREKDQVIVISPSYSVRCMNTDKEGAYRTLVDKTRIMEQQLTDIIRSLEEETDALDHNRHVPSEVEKSKQMQGSEPSSARGYVSEEQNLPQMQENELQNLTREPQHIAEMSRVVEMENLDVNDKWSEQQEQMKSPCTEGGRIIEVTEQENREMSQLSEIEKRKHIEIISNMVECIELPNSEKPPREDLQVEQLGNAELPGSEKSQHDLQIEQLEIVDLPNSDESTCHDLQIVHPNSESPQQGLHMEGIVSNPLCVSMNMKYCRDVQRLVSCNSRLSLDHTESTSDMALTSLDISKDSEIKPHEQANQVSGETEAHPYQAHPNQGQLVVVETPQPELPCSGQPEELRIAKMVEELVLQQQQNARAALHELVLCLPVGSKQLSRPQRRLSKTYVRREHTSQKQPRPSKAYKSKSNSDGSLNVLPLNVQYYSEEHQGSKPRNQRKQSKRKLNYSLTQHEHEQPKQRGRPKNPKSSNENKKQQQAKRQKPRNLDSDTTEGGTNQMASATLMPRDERQSSETPAREMPKTESEMKNESASDDELQQGEGDMMKGGRLTSKVLKEWLARQGLMGGRKREGKA